MADPITPQTPIPSFNLNLEPAAAPASEVVSPVIPTLNIAPAIDQTVEPKQEETPTESTPIVLDIPAAPISENTEEIIQNPNNISDEEVVQNPNTTANEQNEANTEEKNQTPPTDDRLSKEDQLVQEHIEKEEVPHTTEEATQTISPTSDTEKPVVITEAPISEIKIPSSSLQKDMQIIQNIQQTPTTPVVTTTPEIQVSPVVTTNVVETAKPANNSLNLDSIAVTIPQIPVPQTPTIPTIPTAPQIAPNPYDNLQNYIPQIAATGQTNKSQNKGGMIGMVVGIVFIVLAWFVIKTMYPLQYKGIVNGILGTEEESISTEISTSIVGSGDSDSEFGSGDILLGSGENILDDGLIDTGVLEGLSGEVHNSTDTENPTNTEPSIMGTSMSLDEFKTKLEEYSKQGKTKLVEAKKTNNKELIKDSLALYKTADGYLQDIANGKEMSTTDMENISKELSEYLHKVDPSTNAEVATGTEEEPTNNTGSSDFNPDEFFSDSGSTSN